MENYKNVSSEINGFVNKKIKKDKPKDKPENELNFKTPLLAILFVGITAGGFYYYNTTQESVYLKGAIRSATFQKEIVNTTNIKLKTERDELVKTIAEDQKKLSVLRIEISSNSSYWHELGDEIVIKTKRLNYQNK